VSFNNYNKKFVKNAEQIRKKTAENIFRRFCAVIKFYNMFRYNDLIIAKRLGGFIFSLSD